MCQHLTIVFVRSICLIFLFGTDGHLFQVEYAQEAVKQGSTAVAVRGDDCIVIGVEKKAVAALQEGRTARKICKLDDHMALVFAGLQADARVLVNKTRIECQSFRLTVEEPPSPEHIARYVARVQQQYTQKGGRRPFGIATLICGFDGQKPRIFQTMPSGTHSEWKADAIGRGSKTCRDYIEKHRDESKLSEDGAVRLACASLLEVVEAGSKNIEVAVMRPSQELEFLDGQLVNTICEQIAKEKEDKKSGSKPTQPMAVADSAAE